MRGMRDKWMARLQLEEEQGQAIVVIAFALIAMVLFAGLALDAATIYAGQSKLKRAVDSAALAGVVELPSEVTAEARTRQFMMGNGFDTGDPDGTAAPTEPAILALSSVEMPALSLVEMPALSTVEMPVLSLVEIVATNAANDEALVSMATERAAGRLWRRTAPPPAKGST